MGQLNTGTISIIRTSDNSVQLNAISGLSGPFAIAITPDGKYAYVTNFGSNNFSPVGTTVSVINLGQQYDRQYHSARNTTFRNCNYARWLRRLCFELQHLL